MGTRRQELLEELNKIRSKEVNEQLINLESIEGSAIAQLELEKAKADHKVKLECAKAEHEIKVAESKAAISEKKVESASHKIIMIGDFLLKFFIAIIVSAAFIYIVFTGSMASVEEELIGAGSKTSSLFNLLSVVGPLFGMVLQYYFGSKKKSSNGE